jgi:SAM-dependent MidA family methyltransferase
VAEGRLRRKELRVEPVRTAVTPPPADDQGDPHLIELIRSEIERDGPITFARFMERALYEPGLGYYATSEQRPTRAGDFLTAPELHPIFGQTVARRLDEMWRAMGRPRPFVVREYGAGTGAFYMSIVDGLVRMGSDLADQTDYQPIETEGRQPAHENPAGRFIGVAVANEFVDALPVHRVVKRGDALREVRVGWSADRFVEVEGELSDDRLAGWFDIRQIALADGQQAEVNLPMLEWLAQIGRDLERGYVLIFDYGTSAAELYGPERNSGTLRAFRGQHVSGDPFAGVGHQDLTAHVDLDALELGARHAGLDVIGRTRQAEFLLGWGLEEVYAQMRETADQDWDPATTLRSAVRRLLDPRALGGYWVQTLGRDVPQT